MLPTNSASKQANPAAPKQLFQRERQLGLPSRLDPDTHSLQRSLRSLLKISIKPIDFPACISVISGGRLEWNWPGAVAHSSNSQRRRDCKPGLYNRLSPRSIPKEKTEGAYKMSWKPKMHAAKLENSGGIPGTHRTEGIPNFTHMPWCPSLQ